MQREFDVILWGATGFTGALVARYFSVHAPKGLKWALAGRSLKKLEETRESLSNLNALTKNLPLVVANSEDQSTIDKMVKRTKVLCSTVGPYMLYGTPLVKACVEFGTHYCDLTGETPWIKDMIDRYQDVAEKNGVKIVNSCGFDSIPFDMGAFMVADYINRSFNEKCVKAIVYNEASYGGASGGTIASGLNMISDPAVRTKTGSHILDDVPTGKERAKRRPEENDFPFAKFDADIKKYLGPSFMVTVNSRNVRRSKSLFENKLELSKLNPYAPSFVFNEVMAFKSWGMSLFYTVTLMVVFIAFATLARFSVTRRLLKKVLPQPGTGPSEHTMVTGFFTATVIGTSETGRKVRGSVKCHHDPGYMETSLMLSETAMCLAMDSDKTPKLGGVLTPSTAMGSVLLERLKKAGMTFEIVDDKEKKSQ